jgi:hypothetical protein
MGLRDSAAGGLSGIIATMGQGLSTPVKALSSIVSNFGITAKDLANPADLATKIGSAISSYGLNGTAGFGKHVLGNALGRKDPLPSYNWFCTLPTIGNLVLPWHYVEEFTAPVRSYDQVTQFKEGKDNKWPSKMNLSNVSLKCYDDSSGRTGAYWEAWRDLIQNTQTGVFNYSNRYKQNIEVVVLDITRAIQVYTFTYYGCWPTSMDPLSLTSSASDRLTPSIELSVDDVKLTVRTVPPTDMANALLSAVGSGSAGFPGNFMSALNGSDNGLSSAAQGAYTTAGAAMNSSFGNIFV